MYVSTVPNFDFDLAALIADYQTIVASFTFDLQGDSSRKLHLIRSGRPYVAKMAAVPYTASVIDRIKQFSNFDCVTYRVINPHSQYAMHIDPYLNDYSYHIPLITNPLCEFVYEDGARFKMPAGPLYMAQTNIMHTFENNSDFDRVHITFERQII
jgi:aspartyl/asparaginyl beta-hydroxylase (cupin superfamily)